MDKVVWQVAMTCPTVIAMAFHDLEHLIGYARVTRSLSKAGALAPVKPWYPNEVPPVTSPW